MMPSSSKSYARALLASLFAALALQIAVPAYAEEEDSFIPNSTSTPKSVVDELQKQISNLNRRVEEVEKNGKFGYQFLPPKQKDDDFRWIVFIIFIISTITGFWYYVRFLDKNNGPQAVTVKKPGETGENEEQSEEKDEPSRELTKLQIWMIRIFFSAFTLTTVILIITGAWAIFFIFLASIGFIALRHKRITGQIHSLFTKKLNADGATAKIPAITFKDVGALDDIIEEIEDVVDILKDPDEARRWNIDPPKGILFIGPKGTGKTLLANAIAGEARIKLFAHVGSEFGTQYVRSGTQDIKAAFAEARANAPCILFIDEIDAIGGRRGFDSSGEFDHAVTQLLHEVDGFNRRKGGVVLLIGATNNEPKLDPALISRMGKRILVPPPDAKGREDILKIHTQNKILAPEVNLAEIAAQIPGFAGREIANIANEASLCARHRERKRLGIIRKFITSTSEIFKEQDRTITREDFDEAVLKVLVGMGRTIEMLEEERRIVALHELGHAVVTALQGFEVLDKVTLMPRDWALGLTQTSGTERKLWSKAMLQCRVSSILGGRAAEEIFLGKEGITNGAEDDLKKAGELARHMVCELGMGGSLVSYQTATQEPGHGRPFSEYRASKIDEEVDGILNECYRNSLELLIPRREKIEKLAVLLMEKTILRADEIIEYLNNTPA